MLKIRLQLNINEYFTFIDSLKITIFNVLFLAVTSNYIPICVFQGYMILRIFLMTKNTINFLKSALIANIHITY